jgi:hypothetical protein
MAEKRQKYRASTLGQTLGQSLLELIEEGELSNKEAASVLDEFDHAVQEGIMKTSSLRQPQKVKIYGTLNQYNGYDDVWKINIKNAQIVGVEDEVVKVDNLYVLCEEDAPKKRKSGSKH